ncbi:DUF3558 domain-containing protein [Streptomyces sp. SHP 1-2]|uniref:DUF3558 domain-containing protein n=1 Tax=Streptomyces sp. SHP 1-2 TaxID=2769489 RepID=UPI00223820AE|nr:DUF3558 domain-containing protein [Streptomyces sp. SHP 1-2]MCW5253033.1 DUF3558 family protein [Streptomyces sp. SHP 1-2]
MQRRAPRARAERLSRVLVGAVAVPVILAAAGCSSDSGSKDSAAGKPSATPSASPSPTVREAAYAVLPEPCKVLAKGTLKDMVPDAGSGKEGASGDAETRGSCSWDGLDDNGVKGSQFRWLSVSLLRFDSDLTRGPGDELAHEYYGKQVADAQAAQGAKGVKSEPVAETGDEATLVRYELAKKEGAFKQQTVVARVENVVVTLDYNGAGLAGDGAPDAGKLAAAARKAAKEAVAAVAKANAGPGTGAPSGTGSPSAPASPSPSAPASPSPSRAAAVQG